MSQDSKKLCFVIMPIGSRKDGSYKRWKNVYENVIKPAVQKANPAITCFRADDETKAGGIIEDIISHLCADFLCIADITGRNPNVYYELGLRDSWHNRTILITQNHEDAVFDKFGDRALLYHETDLSLIRKFERDIAKAINDIFQNPDSIRNPVQGYLLSDGKSVVETLPASSQRGRVTSDQVREFEINEFNIRVSNLREVMGFEKSYTVFSRSNLSAFERSRHGQIELWFFWNDSDFEPSGTTIYAQFVQAIKELAKIEVVESVSIMFGEPADYQVRSDIIAQVPRIHFVFPYCDRMTSGVRFLNNIEVHFERNREPKPFERLECFLQRYSKRFGNVTIEVWDIKDVEKLEKEHQLTLQ